MSLRASSEINLKRTRMVRVVTSAGKRYDGVIRAITGATLTIWIPAEDRTLTTVAKATTRNGVGFHYRNAV
jgi:hypothetical protein